MERLTYHKPGGGINIRGIDALNPHEINGTIYLCICRLFDYENTGLTPQEVNDILNPCDEEPAPECVHIDSEFAGYKVFALSGTRCVAERIDKLGFDDYVVWYIDNYRGGVWGGVYFGDRQTALAHFADKI